ncbi:MAG TPA: hypothetical protein VLX44_06795, partial [Xanthobacteraceae bacterium]|nr:hypothetical protein [Xanthobacteraceae bacterium]
MRLFDDRLKHRREVAGRRVDDAQYLGGRGLLFQRLAGLGHEPRILHRDHRLRREVLQKRDLLVGKRPRLLPVDHDVPGNAVLAEERHDQAGARAAQIDKGAAVGIAASIRLAREQVGYVDELLPSQETRGTRARSVNTRVALTELGVIRRYTAGRSRSTSTSPAKRCRWGRARALRVWPAAGDSCNSRTFPSPHSTRR